MKSFRRLRQRLRQRLRRRPSRPGLTPFDASALPKREPLSFEAAVGEGIMLAEYAARLRLRNAIIVGALSGQGDYDPNRYLVDARAGLASLAAESDAAARRLAEQLEEAEALSGKAGHAHDYRAGDVKNLARREAVSRALAKRLQECRDDDDYLLSLIERSREEAWNDVSRALEDSLRRADVPVDEDYERERDERMRQLIDEDLAALARERERAQLRSELADDWGF
ncbi:hypothetical protein OH146_11940 [Salinibacterium sp. SYSU T00001]|uniref:hypothetical protein n=1 Tax=Homoserinimonas sedimenticola TaxID=2986805 RepID=UPI00223634EF|nr:hypothetical protein [Salinibacterium sedimenticola]MCW4386484.1 hypothetical protein [Salinibacterium sedimenticola]